MLKLSVRGKLFIISLLLIGGASGATGLFLEHSMLLLGSAVLGLLGALFMSTLAPHLMSESLEPVLSSARGLLRGEHPNLVLPSQNELRRLGDPFHRVANDLRRTFDLLGKERDRFQTMLESMREAVLAVDNERRITLLNSAALNLLELDPTAVGKPLMDAIRLPALNDLVVHGKKEENSAGSA